MTGSAGLKFPNTGAEKSDVARALGRAFAQEASRLTMEPAESEQVRAENEHRRAENNPEGGMSRRADRERQGEDDEGEEQRMANRHRRQVLLVRLAPRSHGGSIPTALSDERKLVEPPGQGNS
jgi:hypothetical protein